MASSNDDPNITPADLEPSQNQAPTRDANKARFKTTVYDEPGIKTVYPGTRRVTYVYDGTKPKSARL